MLFAAGFVAGIATLVFILSWAAWCAFKPRPKVKRPIASIPERRAAA